MVKTVCKVDNISESIFDDISFNKIKNSLLLRYINPIVSISFLKDDLSLEKGMELGKKSNINFDKDKCSLLDGTVIDNDLMEYIVISDMLNCAKKALDNDTENKYFVANVVKDRVSKKIKSDTKLSVDDLMRMLYSSKEEKSKSL